MTEIQFDVECPDCACQFIKKEHHISYYCPNCRNWKSVDTFVTLRGESTK